MWTYRGIDIFRSSTDMGTRWQSEWVDLPKFSGRLRADTKDGMRDLINHYR